MAGAYRTKSTREQGVPEAAHNSPISQSGDDNAKEQMANCGGKARQGKE